MQLSLIRENYPEPIDEKQRLWINPKDRGLYFGLDRIFINYDDIDTPATIGDLDRELERRNYFSLEQKFIDSSGNLVLNTLKTNINYDKRTKKITYDISETRDKSNRKVGVSLRTYKSMKVDFINADTSLHCIDLIEGTETCKIIFPEDRVTSVSLVELSKKFVIPELSCELSSLEISFTEGKGLPYSDVILYDDVSKKDSIADPTLFKYVLDQSDNQHRRQYNTSLSENILYNGFILDLTNDGLLSLYLLKDPTETVIDIYDYYIKSCSVKLVYS